MNYMFLYGMALIRESVEMGALKLRGFKAEPSVGIVEARFKPFGECDIDPYAEGCPGAF
jgi:hypothetical protein